MVLNIENKIIDMGANSAINRLNFASSNSNLQVNVTIDDSINGISISRNGQQVEICCSKKIYMYRALGLLKQHEDDDCFSLIEKAAFKTNGLLIDCSRNAVPKISTLKTLLDNMALMGLDSLLLYMEDTYEIADEPYFGYMRGGYSLDDLKYIVEYADEYGIEVVPCIQTLAHLNTMLKLPNYYGIKDIDDVLLVNEDKTYELIEKMISTCRKVFKSKRIHIGMDEAHYIGRGKYLDQNGYEDPHLLMCQHLAKVNDICIKYNFEPMIWSDLLFKWANNGNYYGENPISEKIISSIPNNIQLTYWDYYSNDEKVYDRMLKMHFDASDNISFAGGAWKWNGYFPYIKASFDRTQKALNACRRNNVSDVFITAWGDDGSDCSLFSILPMMQQQAELNFTSEISEEDLNNRFKTCTGANLEDFMLIDMSTKNDNGYASSNFHKYMLFQDVLLGMFDCHVSAEITERFIQMNQKIASINKECTYGYIFETLETLTALLSKKVELGVKIKSAYENNDIDYLSNAANKIIPNLISLTETFRDKLETQWTKENKYIGFEVQDIRLGALVQRMKSAQNRIIKFLNGEINQIEELTVERLPYHVENHGKTVGLNVWQEMITTNVF